MTSTVEWVLKSSSRVSPEKVAVAVELTECYGSNDICEQQSPRLRQTQRKERKKKRKRGKKKEKNVAKTMPTQVTKECTEKQNSTGCELMLSVHSAVF